MAQADNSLEFELSVQLSKSTKRVQHNKFKHARKVVNVSRFVGAILGISNEKFTQVFVNIFLRLLSCYLLMNELVLVPLYQIFVLKRAESILSLGFLPDYLIFLRVTSESRLGFFFAFNFKFKKVDLAKLGHYKNELFIRGRRALNGDHLVTLYPVLQLREV